MDLQTVLLEVENWSAEDKLRLIEQVWDNLGSSPTVMQLTDAQKADLERRIAEEEAAPNAGSTWEEVKGRLLGHRE